LALGLELRRFETEYTSGDFTATHINVAAAWKF
jgi:hypothetical protein